MTAWVIVRDDSSPGAPIYWSGLNRHYSDGGWSHNHQHAVRFAQMQDAEKVASEVRRTTPCHVEEHSWFVSAPPPVAARPCPVCNQFHGAISSACPGPDPLGFSPERLAQGEADVAAGRVVPLDQVVERLQVAAREDPFCPLHGPARASDHAAAGCTCRPDAREEPKREEAGVSERKHEHQCPLCGTPIDCQVICCENCNALEAMLKVQQETLERMRTYFGGKGGAS